MKLPPNQSPFDSNGKPDPMWVEFMFEVYRSIVAMQSSGPTTSRPAKGLYINRPYFDTTLGIPVWYDGTDWVDAQGNSV